jgi:hypothetical protein
MLGSDGRLIRRIRAMLAEGQLVTLALPPGVERVQLGSTKEDPRVRVELAQRSPRCSRTEATSRPAWVDDSDTAMWWRWLRTRRKSRRAAWRP